MSLYWHMQYLVLVIFIFSNTFINIMPFINMWQAFYPSTCLGISDQQELYSLPEKLTKKHAHLNRFPFA